MTFSSQPLWCNLWSHRIHAHLNTTSFLYYSVLLLLMKSFAAETSRSKSILCYDLPLTTKSPSLNCVYMRVYVCTYLRVHTRVCVCVHACVCVYTHCLWRLVPCSASRTSTVRTTSVCSCMPLSMVVIECSVLTVHLESVVACCLCLWQWRGWSELKLSGVLHRQVPLPLSFFWSHDCVLCVHWTGSKHRAAPSTIVTRHVFVVCCTICSIVPVECLTWRMC